MTVTLLEGHVVDVLEGLPAGHFHTVVTSPPYAWLRAYGTESQVWQTADGDALCAPEQHEWVDGEPRPPHPLPSANTTLVKGQRAQAAGQSGAGSAHAFCVHCHAWRGELGQEPTIELYVEHLVAVFRSVKRVLRPDGTLWVNLAGCYYNDPGGQNEASLRNGQGATGLAGGGQRLKDLHAISQKAIEANRTLGRQKRGRHPWLKPLDWVDVPGLFARAMQQDGWTWRSDVVWVKPSALPESVSGTRWERCKTKTKAGEGILLKHFVATEPDRKSPPHRVDGAPTGPTAEWADCPGCPKCAPDGLVLRRGSGRPTKTHEHVQLYTKGPGYFYDTEAVREPNTEGSIARFADDPMRVPVRKYAGWEGLSPAGMDAREWRGNGRNARDVWEIGPEPLKDAHYAAFPSALPERCIKAGTSEWGCCPACGAPWARIIDQGPLVARRERPGKDHHTAPQSYIRDGKSRAGDLEWSTTLGWRPTCACGEGQPPVPARCLDPFGGSGTTALAANRLGRDCTLVELKPQYAELARKRVGREPLSLFAWRNEDSPEEVQV